MTTTKELAEYNRVSESHFRAMWELATAGDMLNFLIDRDEELLIPFVLANCLYWHSVVDDVQSGMVLDGKVFI